MWCRSRKRAGRVLLWSHGGTRDSRACSGHLEGDAMPLQLGRRSIAGVMAMGLVLGRGAAAAADDAAVSALPHVLSASVGSVSPNSQSGGIAACDVAVGESGSVSSVSVVQDLAPYGE